MKKNVSGQSVGAQMITASDGTAFTGTITVVITEDNGTQTASGGTAPAHEGNGYHSYSPTQGETDADHIAFTWTGTGAIPVTIQVYTTFPQTVDNDVLASGTTGFAAIDTVVDAIKVKTDFLPSATAGAAGGVFIAGTNAATVVTTSFTTTFTGNLTGSVASVTADVGITQAGADKVWGTTARILTASTNFNDLSFADIWTTALTEAYAADGVAGTATQVLFMTQQIVAERNITGTTLTIAEIDGTTTAATFTLDDGTNPTDQTRAT